MALDIRAGMPDELSNRPIWRKRAILGQKTFYFKNIPRFCFFFIFRFFNFKRFLG